MSRRSTRADSPRSPGGGIVAPWVFYGALGLVVGALYLIGDRTAGTGSETTARRGLAVLNAGANAALLSSLGHPGTAVAAGALGLAASYEEAAREPRIKTALGWTNWLLPMSWPVTLVGALAFAGDVAVHAATGGRWEAARIRSVRFDRASGTVITEGGILVKPGFRGGFNFGNFSFITPDAQVVEDHETGHALNLAAFGWIFHLIGGFDRKLREDPATAYAERLAESNRSPSPRQDWVGQWGEPETRSRKERA